MEKANVIKALEICGANRSCSKDCPYHDMEKCDSKMCLDAMALLKANVSAKPKYPYVYVYTKKGNLLPWYQSQDPRSISMSTAEYYGKERDIELIAMFRWDNGKCFCKIKCPVNPLPVKGEFETPAEGIVRSFLHANGWSLKQKLHPHMFE